MVVLVVLAFHRLLLASLWRESFPYHSFSNATPASWNSTTTLETVPNDIAFPRKGFAHDGGGFIYIFPGKCPFLFPSAAAAAACLAGAVFAATIFEQVLKEIAKP